MSVFSGLYSYEAILLVLGIVLFVMLMAVLVIYALKGREIASLLPFLGVVVLMIGFPGIQKFNYNNGVIEIERIARTAAVGDTSAAAKVDDAIRAVAPRARRDPEALLRFAQAKATLGDSIAALTYADSALTVDPGLQPARQFQKQILTPRVDLERTVNRFNANPRNEQLRRDVTTKVGVYEQRRDTSFVGSMTKARARAAIGDTALALNHLDSAAVRNPKLAARDVLIRPLFRP
jgi:hypothetical protein